MSENGTVIAYRFFNVSNGVIRSANGDLTWPAPKNGKAGVWVRHKDKVVICESGLHASPTISDALRCRQGATLGRVKARRIEERHADKFVCREMRVLAIFSRKHLLGLAFLAAAKSLPIFERRVKGDERPRKAVKELLYFLRTGDMAGLRAAADNAWQAYAAAEAAAADAAFAAYAAYAAAAYAAEAAEAAEAACAAAAAQFDAWLNEYGAALLAVPEDGVADFCEAAWMEIDFKPVEPRP